MNDQLSLNILNTLAVTPPSNSLFENPLDYLKWFLKQVNGLFIDDNKIRFANVQYFSSLYFNHNGFLNGRLLNIPTLFNLDVVKIETLVKTLTEITGFLASTSIVQKFHSEANKVTIDTFLDKLKIETTRDNTQINTNHKVLFNREQNILTFYIPDLYDPSISVSLMGKDFYLNSDLIIDEFGKGHIILDGFIVDKKLENYFNSSRLQILIGEVQKFINSSSTQKLIHEYIKEFNSIDYFDSFNELKDQIPKFIITDLLHSWFKPNCFDYQIIVSKCVRNKPQALGNFLITSEAQPNTRLINYLQIAE